MIARTFDEAPLEMQLILVLLLIMKWVSINHVNEDGYSVVASDEHTNADITRSLNLWVYDHLAGPEPRAEVLGWPVMVFREFLSLLLTDRKSVV